MKTILALFFWGVFVYIVLQIPYPETIVQANITQLVYFFVSLFFSITLSVNILLRNIFISSAISLGVIFSLILKALDSLNLVTGGLLVISISLLISYFRRIRTKDLTNLPKIHKLTHLRRQK